MADPTTPSAGADPAPALRPRASRGWRLWGWLSAALLMVAAIVVVGAPREPDSVAHVREFLTAVRERRVTDALALAGADRPRGDAGRFVTAKALSDDWEIVALREDYHSDAIPAGRGWSGEPEKAEVEVAIRAAGNTAVFELSLVKQDDKWRIEHPFQKVIFPATGLLYVDVNGVKAPVARSAKESVRLLLPGAYRFYTDIPGIAKIASKPTLVVPDSYAADEGRRVDYNATMTLMPKGERAAQAALKAYIDECARSTELAPVGCPFAADRNFGPQSEEYRSVRDFRKITWKVSRYPKAAILADLDGIAFADRRRGSVKVTVTATEEDTNKDIRYSVTCEMRLNDFGIAIGMHGKLVIVPPYGRFNNADSKDTRARFFDTCRN
jgi:hypothetical protein